MNSKEKVFAVLDRKKISETPVALTPWPSTLKKWQQQGHISNDVDFHEHFDLDLRRGGDCINSIADLNFEPKVLEETEETELILDGNGATLRFHKAHEGTPEHVDFDVKDRHGWFGRVRSFFENVDERRLNFDSYLQSKKVAEANQRFFYYATMAPFEQMHRLCGHENLLMAMALDPQWVQDMVMTYTRFTINHLEILFDRCGKPDALFYFEDMGFKQKPFMSPKMYDEIMYPGHKQLFDYAHNIGLKVIVHSCGFVEPLLEGLIRAGMDCLQAMEVKAGMDLPALQNKFGDRIAFFGGFDVRALISNDKRQIDDEFKRIHSVIDNGGYILHSDHSEPPEIEYDTIRYFLEKGRSFT